MLVNATSPLPKIPKGMRGYSIRKNQGRILITTRASYHVTRQTARFSSTNPPAFYPGASGGQQALKAIAQRWKNLLTAQERADWGTYAANNAWVDDNLTAKTINGFEMFIVFNALLNGIEFGSPHPIDTNNLQSIGPAPVVNSFHWTQAGLAVFNLGQQAGVTFAGSYWSLKMNRRPLFSPSNGGWIPTTFVDLWVANTNRRSATTLWKNIHIPVGSQPLTQMQTISSGADKIYLPTRFIPSPTTAS